MQNDGLVPSGVRTGRGMISRASVLGVIIEKQEMSFSLDDGTTSVSVRSFDAKVPVRAGIGDIVLVIGRPREYNGERYLALEICKKLRNNGWAQYRKTELSLLGTSAAPEITSRQEELAPVAHTVQVLETVKNPYETITERIRALDVGNGADIEEVLAAVPESEKLLRSLIEEGEIFEIRPGKLKVLE